MATEIYYNPINNGVLVTSEFSEWQKNMDLGIGPKINYEIITLDDFESRSIKSIALEAVDESYFQHFKSVFSNYAYDTVCFRRTHVDLTGIVIRVNHLILDECKVDISAHHFRNLKEITFLRLKNYKGKILDTITSVEKIILWYENRKANAVLAKFPEIKILEIYNGSTLELDLTSHSRLETLQLHRCIKLLKVALHSECKLNRVIVRASNKLDVGNLGKHVIKV